ncbi:aminotransferase class V-fold PLP-dependent enzyme [Lysinibacillus sp. NPDC097195]|uniref:aminotransferase class V-fold PLP-dependent enzyme n=1 Tax=Lysinibacillus sp. NPDC097195 TaxID=3364141 RepID=UPI0037F5DF04
MYWCKIAQTDAEFDAIAQLNYATFVEEIPQHEPNELKRKVDRFHQENTYLVVYKETELIGMLAFRDKRPFSIDEKIGEVEQYLPTEICSKLCEVRLLAVKIPYRTGRVLLRITQALNAFAYEKGYSAAVISGTTREEKLYKQMGFKQFAPAVGTAEAMFLPMVLTRQQFEQSLQQKLAHDSYTFYPGPVKQQGPILYSAMSHRSHAFQSLYKQMRYKLLELSNAKHIATFVGTGTLANEVMLGQLKAQRAGYGLILTNGEFGERLYKQAERWSLDFDIVKQEWASAFDLQSVETLLQTGSYQWLLLVHGETSTGTCNNLASIARLTKRYNIKLCVDCISTFGAMPFSLADCFLATAVSGKALGALSGLAFVFSQQQVASSTSLPAYLDLGNYQQGEIPYTLPASLVGNVAHALQAYPARYSELQQRFQALLQLPIMDNRIETTTYPMIVTIQCAKRLSNISTDLKLNGLYVHGDSEYLRQRHFIQLSVIQPDFDKAFSRLHDLLTYYLQTVDE